MNYDDLLAAMKQLKPGPPPIEAFVIGHDDFDEVVTLFTAEGALIVTLENYGWHLLSDHCVIVEETPFGVKETSLMVHDGIEKGQSFVIYKKKPSLQLRFNRADWEPAYYWPTRGKERDT